MTSNSSNFPFFEKSYIIFGRSQHQSLLFEALESCEERVILICPFINTNATDPLMPKFQKLLERGVKLDICWGWKAHIKSMIITGKGYWRFQPLDPWQYNGIRELHKFRQPYPEQFCLKLIGTHAKILIADTQFAVITSYNFLCSPPCDRDHNHEEVGVFTTNLRLIQDLIHCFDSSPNLIA